MNMIYILALNSLMLFSYASDQSNDFDNVCKIFTDFKKNRSSYPSDPLKFTVLINNKIDKTLKTEAGKNTFSVVSEVVNKYEVIKKGAEQVLNKDWDCPAMKDYYGQ